jgi:hypothetical protein
MLIFLSTFYSYNLLSTIANANENCGKSPNYSTESPDSKAKFYLQMRGVECTQDLVSLLEGSRQEKLFRSFNWGPTKEANR